MKYVEDILTTGMFIIAIIVVSALGYYLMFGVNPAKTEVPQPQPAPNVAKLTLISDPPGGKIEYCSYGSYHLRGGKIWLAGDTEETLSDDHWTPYKEPFAPNGPIVIRCHWGNSMSEAQVFFRQEANVNTTAWVTPCKIFWR